jgi:hypothetical protein
MTVVTGPKSGPRAAAAVKSLSICSTAGTWKDWLSVWYSMPAPYRVTVALAMPPFTKSLAVADMNSGYADVAAAKKERSHRQCDEEPGEAKH